MDLIQSEKKHAQLLNQLKMDLKLEHVNFFKEHLPLILESLQSHPNYSYPTLEPLLNSQWNNNKRSMLKSMMQTFNPIYPNEIKEKNLFNFISYAGLYVGQNNEHFNEFLAIIEEMLNLFDLSQQNLREEIIIKIETSEFLEILPHLLSKGFKEDWNYLKLSIFQAIIDANHDDGMYFFNVLINLNENKIKEIISTKNIEKRSFLDMAFHCSSYEMFKKLVVLGARFTEKEMSLNEQKTKALTDSRLNFYHQFLIEEEKRILEQSLSLQLENKKHIKL